MEKLDDTFFEMQLSFDTGVKKARTADAFDKMKKVFLEMIECLDAIKEDYLEPLVPETNEILTVKKVSMEYDISTITLYKLIKAQTIPVIRFGNKIRIRRSDIEVYSNSSKFGI